MNLLKSLSDKDNKKQALYDLAKLRAQLAITHAFDGFDIETSEALDLLKSSDDDLLTELDKEKRARLVAAVNNLIEFAVCEEYQLTSEIYSTIPDFDFDTEIFNPDDEENEDDDIDMNIHRDSEDLEKVRSFVNFLRRRKAYLLINLGRYEEARTLLQILLQDPENSDLYPEEEIVLTNVRLINSYVLYSENI